MRYLLVYRAEKLNRRVLIIYHLVFVVFDDDKAVFYAKFLVFIVKANSCDLLFEALFISEGQIRRNAHFIDDCRAFYAAVQLVLHKVTDEATLLDIKAI